MKLTIAIPTYNRKEIIIESLEKMHESEVLHDVALDFIISDNGSDDGTYDALLDFKSRRECHNLKIIGTDKNYGYTANLKKILFESSSKYTVIISDEDPIYRENTAKLWLELSKMDCGFVSTLFHLDGRVYRGTNIPENSIIDGNTIREMSNYLSGIVFNTKLGKLEWNRIGLYLEDPRNQYPQVCLAAVLSARYGGHYLPIEVSYKLNQAEPAQIYFDIDYNSPKSRFNEFIFFCEFFKEQMKFAESSVESIFYTNAIEWISGGAFPYYFNYLSREFPEAVEKFVKSSAEYILGSIQKKEITLSQEDIKKIFH